MKAVCWMGKRDVRVETVPDPTILNPRDAVIKVTSTAICGSDLHLVDGYFPTMLTGDILGHEFMGEVMETGAGVTTLRPGDRVVVPFTISCGYCWFCQKGLWAACDNSNPKAWMSEELFGLPGSAFFGYGQISGGYAGGQAEYVRVPFADVGPIKIPDGLPDERALFLGDIFPTAYMAAENCNIEPGDTVAIWGCGPVGLLAIRCAFLLGAEQVIAIDRVPERLAVAERAGARTINYAHDDDVVEQLKQLTGGRGPDSCMDAVGMEAHGTGKDWYYDRAKQALRMTYDRPHVLREAIQACRKAGSVSVPGVYGSFIDKFPMGAVFDKGLTIKSGQTHVQRYLQPLLRRIQEGDIDPSFIITKRIGLEDAPDAYTRFRDKEDGYVKVVMTPNSSGQRERAAVGSGAREDNARG